MSFNFFYFHITSYILLNYLNETVIMSTAPALQPPKGVILPPPEVRSTIEKTVGYVLRNGSAFEARIQQTEQSNTKFAFLQPEDAYRPYYEWRLIERQNGGEELLEPANGSSANGSSGSAPLRDDSGKPESFEFAFDLPSISAKDLDVVKLTALYVAKHGSQFQKTLQQKEAKNYQFEFLNSAHSLFPLYTSLIQQYKQVLTPSSKLTTKVESSVKDPFQVLVKAKQRAEWKAKQEDDAAKEAKRREEERIAYASVDWHDFVVVETIRFTPEDKTAKLPAPVSLAQLKYASLEEKRLGSLRIEEAPPDYDAAEEKQSEPKPVVSASEPPRVNPEIEIEERKIEERRQQMQRKQEAQSTGSTLPPNMKIRSAGTSRLSKAKSKGERMIKSQFTGELIPESKYDEHVRITLLDPKWKEQKALSEQRQSTTNLVSSEAAATVKRLASELFSDGRSKEEEERVKRGKKEVQWDGYSNSKEAARAMAQAGTSKEDIEEQKRKEIERLNAIGPRKQ